MKLLLQWLYPGLNIKRWMLLFSFGLMLLAFGAALVMNYQVFGRIEEEILRLLFVLTGTYSYTFLAAAGIFFVFIGLFFMLWAIRRLVKRFFSLVAPDQESVSRHIVSKWELSRGLKVVAIGGGHGLSMLLRGLKTKTSNISAIVTVADDGGSSGRLREEMNIVAPGDLRNCLVALADKETVLEQLFQYRFGGEGELAGHSLGNLFLAALMKEFGNVQNALETASTVYVEKKGGKVKIIHVDTVPSAPIAVGDALEAIRNADLITLGPGSLYTSVLPDLLVPEILTAIKESSAPCMYICNVMTQPGETLGYTVSDHLKALVDHVGKGVIDYVLVNNGVPKKDVLKRYEKVQAHPVEIDRKKIQRMGIILIEEDLLGVEKGAVHDTDTLCNEIIRISGLLKTNIAPEVLSGYLGRAK